MTGAAVRLIAVSDSGATLKLNEAAACLGIDGGELGKLIDTGRLPLERNGPWLVIPEAAIDELLAEQAQS